MLWCLNRRLKVGFPLANHFLKTAVFHVGKFLKKTLTLFKTISLKFCQCHGYSGPPIQISMCGLVYL